MKTTSKELIYYHIWDIDPKDIIEEVRYAKKSDKGKYAKLDDGSELYVLIKDVTNTVIRTTAGLFRRWDLVYCSVPKDPDQSVCGIDPSDIHPLVRGYTMTERRIAKQLIQHPNEVAVLSKRVKMLTMEKIKQQCETRGIEETEIIDLIIDTAKDKGLHFKWSMTLLMSAFGMDANEFVYSHMQKELPQKEVQRITTLPNGSTITEVNVLPTKRDFTKMLSKVNND